MRAARSRSAVPVPGETPHVKPHEVLGVPRGFSRQRDGSKGQCPALRLVHCDFWGSRGRGRMSCLLTVSVPSA